MSPPFSTMTSSDSFSRSFETNSAMAPATAAMGPTSANREAPDHLLNDSRGVRIFLERNQAACKFGMRGDIGFELMAVFQNGLSGFLREIPFCPDKKVSLFDDDLKFDEVIGLHQVSVSPFFIHLLENVL